MEPKERKAEKGRPRWAVVLVVAATITIVALAALARRDESTAERAGGTRATAPVVAHPAHGLHPAPRRGDLAGRVVPAGRFGGYPRIADAYSKAAEVPEVLDGIHCYCDCGEHAGHYSLLDCFASDHAAACDICLSEAGMAFRMTSRGRSLDEIRLLVDATFGG